MAGLDDARKQNFAAPLDTPDVPADLAADFAPLPESGASTPTTGTENDPYHQDSLLAEVAFNQAVEAAARGDEDGAVKHYLRASKLAETAREWYLAAASCQRVGDFLQNPRPPSDLERAFRMYRRAVAAYEQCGYLHEARRLLYTIQWLRLRRARSLNLPWWLRVELFLYWLVAGFGYRPLRLIGITVAVILFHGLLYWLLDGVVIPGSQEPVGFWQALYFSGITFSTVGYGDVLPAPHVRLLALTEGILGVFMMGFFVVVLGNRLRQ